MKQRSHKLRRGLLITFAVIIGIVILVIAFISPIAKYVIEKYDHKILGRKIRMDWIYVNPFTGAVHISNLKLYEPNDDTLFFNAKGVDANFAMLKLLKKTYEIENITITKPWARVIQNRKDFNFNDLIIKFSPKDSVPHPDKEPTRFSILNVKIEEGEFHYIESSIPVNYYIKDVNIESPGWQWNVDSMMVKIGLKSGPAPGDMAAKFNLNFSTKAYALSAKVDKYDLKFLEDYLHDMANYGAISANLDADIKATGNLGNKIAVSVAGLVAVNDFHFGKKAGDDYASFKKLAIDMKEINPLGYKYIFDSIMLNEPYFKFERYDYLDNVQREFGKGGGNVKAAYADSSKFNLIIELAKYIRDLSKNLVQSYYKADKIAIYSADMKFNDFSLREKFGVSGNPLNLYTDSIDKNKQRMVVNLKTALKPYGNVSVKLSLDPNDFGYFDLEYSIQKIPLAMFNPYVISYTSFPLDRGTFEFNGYLSVDDSVIKSDNHILIIDPRVAKRLRKKDTKWLPVPLMMSVVRGPGDAIDYDIPISGDLRNPKFHFKDVILSVLSNLFVKPPATPYLIHEKHVENQVEKLLTIKWQTHSTELLPKQEKFAEKMAKFLGDNPQTSVTVSPLEYTEKEKEYVLFFEAKKKYFQLKHGGKNLQITEDDSLAIEKMSVKDSLFVKYMNKFIGDTNMFTIQEKCIAFIGSGTVNAKYEQLLKDRQGAFMAFFKSTGAEKQVKVATSKSSVPYDGFSYYKIDYKGELPKDLQKATEEMNDLDQEAPRVRFKKARDRNGGIVPEIKGK